MSHPHVEFLQQIHAFSALDDGLLARLAASFAVRQVARDDKLVRRGDPGNEMFVVRSGEVRVPVVDAVGRERFVAELGPGDLFGEMALMTGDPRSADVVAATDVTVLVLSKPSFSALLHQAPSVAEVLTRILAERLAAGDMSAKRIGKYQLQRELGRGGMSVVYSAVHADLDTLVAVKMLSHRLAYDDYFTASFRKEARVIASLRHPNIVQVFDTERAYATYFIVMEYVRGQLLSDAIHTRGRLAPEDCRGVLVDLASALDYAHGRGVVHRDVKPANVFLDEEGTVRLMDFGVAHRQEDESDGKAAGTPQYMAPEQCLGEVVDGRADVYALGMTAFQMLTGTFAFHSPDPVEVMKAQVLEPLPDLRERAPGCPDDLVEWVVRATQKERERRFQSGAEAAAALASGEAGALSRIKVLSIAHTPGEELRVNQALAALQLDLAHAPGRIRISVANLSDDEPA